jgi:hypothetical protein
MTETEKLVAIEAIRTLKATYFRCMDTKKWDELAEVFAIDATFDARRPLEMPGPEALFEREPIIIGRAAIVAFISTGLGPLISVHHGHMPEIAIDSPSAARAIWPMTDLLIAPPGAPFRTFRGYGHYHETYRLDGDRWRIATLKLRRLYVESIT